jgi:hypothetical protein
MENCENSTVIFAVTVCLRGRTQELKNEFLLMLIDIFQFWLALDNKKTTLLNTY